MAATARTRCCLFKKRGFTVCLFAAAGVLQLVLFFIWIEGVEQDLSEESHPTAMWREDDLAPLFYMYEGWPLDWSTVCDTEAKAHRSSKHGDDVWFWETAKDHPRRTRDPLLADLFVVPLMLSAALSGYCRASTGGGRLGSNETSDFLAMQSLQDAAADALQLSPWYQRTGGADHIVVASHFDHGLFLLGHFSVNSKLRHAMRNMVFGRFEHESFFVNGFAPGLCFFVWAATSLCPIP